MLIASAFESLSLSLFPFMGKKIAPYAKRMATTDSGQRKRVLLSVTTSCRCGFRLVSFSPRGQTEEIKLSGTAASTDSISTYWILSRAISSRRPQYNVPRGVRHRSPTDNRDTLDETIAYNECVTGMQLLLKYSIESALRTSYVYTSRMRRYREGNYVAAKAARGIKFLIQL